MRFPLSRCVEDGVLSFLAWMHCIINSSGLFYKIFLLWLSQPRKRQTFRSFSLSQTLANCASLSLPTPVLPIPSVLTMSIDATLHSASPFPPYHRSQTFNCCNTLQNRVHGTLEYCGLRWGVQKAYVQSDRDKDGMWTQYYFCPHHPSRLSSIRY